MQRLVLSSGYVALVHIHVALQGTGTAEYKLINTTVVHGTCGGMLDEIL